MSFLRHPERVGSGSAIDLEQMHTRFYCKHGAQPFIGCASLRLAGKAFYKTGIVCACQYIKSSCFIHAHTGLAASIQATVKAYANTRMLFSYNHVLKLPMDSLWHCGKLPSLVACEKHGVHNDAVF